MSTPSDSARGAGQLRRLQEQRRAVLRFELDGVFCEGLEGDTVLTAILVQRRRLRDNEFTGAPRAGFCLMGACQDCLVWLEGGERVRACATPLRAGMRLRTAPVFAAAQAEPAEQAEERA
ncbi:MULTISPECIES: (2Fe-2S)-binding protein [Cupriavidus]|uniref:(2Fe-2S)-binding protein n=1 Tax=Cupriavidus TaxID=106589 RepID=UPI0003671D20|nr:MULTISPECIES: (2Fe-2S)-binding protein [Cupriavidus]